jgi:hypothetical protein
MSRVTNDISEVENSVVSTLEGWFKDPLQIILTLAFLFFLRVWDVDRGSLSICFISFCSVIIFLRGRCLMGRCLMSGSRVIVSVKWRRRAFVMSFFSRHRA